MPFRPALPRLMWLTMVVTMAQAQDPQIPHTPEAGSEERLAILDAARSPAQQELGKPVRFLVDALNAQAEWAFLYARMRDAHDEPIDYRDTPYAGEAAQGGRSQAYAALLRHDDGAWQVVRHRTGPTDAVWLGWSDAGAPESLFAIPGD